MPFSQEMQAAWEISEPASASHTKGEGKPFQLSAGPSFSLIRVIFMFHVVSFRLRLYSFTKVSVLNISENIRCLGPELHCLICSSAKDLELVKISPSFTSPSQSHLPRCLPSPIGGDCCALLLFYFKFLLLPPLHCFLPYNFWPWLHLPCARILEVSLSSTIVEAVIFRILFFFLGGGEIG